MATRMQKGVATTIVLSALALVVAVAGSPFPGPFGNNGGGNGGGSSSSAATFTSTQSDGGAAYVAPTGSKVCLNGAACTVYAQYDGGSIGLVGSEVDVPAGFTDSQKVNADSDIGPRGVIAQAGSGEYAFRVTHGGAKIDFGPSTGDDECAYGNATSSGSSSVECGTFTFSQANIGQISPRGALQYVNVVAGMGLKLFGFNLGTCNSSSERSIVVPGDAGGTTGHRTRICICASDGAATPTYYWVNTAGTVGTDTTCPYLEP